ncbi:MAG: hypothetical protein ACREQ5_40325, partial [Candidatus Dormibacteria bacterium]
SVHAPGVGRLPTTMAPAEVGPEATALLDAVVPPDRLVAIPGLPGAELDLLADALEAMEKEVSGQRRRLHAVLDALQGEVVRRYRSGEATVDGFFG